MATRTLHEEISSNKHKTIGLLIAFILFVAAIVAFISVIYTGELYVSFVAIPLAAAYALFSYYGAGKMAVSMSGAKQIQEADNPRLYRIVENLAITLGMPMPKVYIIEDPGLNAFATGRNPENAIVAATTGLLSKLEDNELEGVMAHEMGHIKNYDIRVSMMAFALVALISIIADIAMRAAWLGSGSRDRNSNGAGLVIGLLIAIVAPFIASIIRMAISRQREYLADATGALTTRYPEGLASALEKIKLYGSTTVKQNSATAHFYFSNPLKKSNSAMFSTHPPLESRIARLRDMEDGVLGNGR